jgi:hypothetical protein
MSVFKNKGQNCKTGPVFSGVGTSGGEGGYKERVNMVEILCTHI